MLSMEEPTAVVHCTKGITGKRETGSSQRCTPKGLRQWSHIVTRENLVHEKEMKSILTAFEVGQTLAQVAQ